MKKNIKIFIIAFILGATIFSGITVVTAYTVLANSVSYTPKSSGWKVDNVGDAIDSLYISKAGDNYTTSEREVGTWIDGKTIYQKTISLGGTITLSADTWYTTNISSSNMDMLIDIVGYHMDDQSTFVIKDLRADTNAGLGLELKTPLGSTRIQYLTVQYTKK